MALFRRSLLSSTSFAVYIATLLGFWLRALRLDFQPLWFDEGYSLYFANHDLLGIASLTAADIHPPFYYYLLNTWMAFSGSGDVSVRTLSVFAGTLSIPVLYALGSMLFGRGPAVAGAALFALSPLHVYYSQEVRMYSPVTLLVLLSTWAFAALSERAGRGSARLWLTYVVAESLSLYTQYFAGFVPLAHLAFLLVRRRNPPRLWRRWILAQLAVFTAFLPWTLYAGSQLATYVGGKVSYEGYTPLGLFDFHWRLLVALAAGTERPDVWQWVAVTVIVLAVAGAMGWMRHRGPSPSVPLRAGVPSGSARGGEGSPLSTPGIREGVLLCSLVILVSSFGGWLVNQFLPFNPPRWERLYLFAAPFFVLLAAMGIEWLGRQRQVLAWCGLAIGLLTPVVPLYVFYTAARYPGEDYRPLVKTVSAFGQPGDLVVAVYPWQIGYFQSYTRGFEPRFALLSGDEWNDHVYRDDRLEAFGRSHDRVWLPAYQALGGILESQVESHLAGYLFPALNEWHGNTRLVLFDSGSEPPLTPRTANFDGLVSLLGYGLQTKPVPAGEDAVDVALSWQAQKKISGKLVVKLRLYDEAGRTWAQRDSAPAGGLKPAETWATPDRIEDRHGLLVPAGTPPGEYKLGLSLTLNGNSLNIVEADGNPHGQELPLGKVQVVKPSRASRLESLPVRTRLASYLGDGVEIAGYSMGSTAAKPGDTFTANVFWRARQAPSTDHEVVFRLVDKQGKVAGEQRKPVGQSYPARQWSAGEAIRDQYDLTVPAPAASGVYELRLAFDGGASYVRLDSIRVEGREHVFTARKTAHAAMTRFGDAIAVVGFDIGGQLEPADDATLLGRIKAGDTLVLKPLWRVEKEIGRNLKVFSHVVDAGSRIWGQRDGVPGSGDAPTAGWIRGEYVEDSYVITVKADTPSGKFEVWIGFYDPISGARLPAYDAAGLPAGDKAILGKIEVWR